ncbi:uncharacterized protein N7483_008120 [Penicillium malachiteum]|uniref:uncharacterized protein n=1 Tax=Penicillium malachiteum TaxID=1324776 RepID=UPI00254969B2|nr:uncharacterized protein N7483_008120 [Penicillium malachiteum]KAJ5726763.1 hypothetical protein N7483_008120 [Penicillium malachiteum]
MSDHDKSTSHSSDSHDLDRSELAFNNKGVNENGNTEKTANKRDIGLEEAGQQPLEKSGTEGSNASQQDSKLVTWNGPDDPDNPKNWTKKKKWISMGIVAMFTLLSPVSSTMVTPALTAIGEDLHITEEFVLELTMSIFILAYAIEPLFLGPFSETYGRAVILQLANLFYLAFNIGCGFAQTKSQILAFRFFSGLGASVPLVVGGGVLGDMFRAEERGSAMAIFSLAPLLGPSLGPIMGGFIAENTTWRWVFYATSIATGVAQVAGLFLLRETYAPRILKRSEKNKSLLEDMQIAFVRPFRLLITQPIILVLTLYMSYTYGLLYFLMSTFPDLWTSPDYYNEFTGIGGLNYISLGLGSLLGTYICVFLNDRTYRRLKARNNDIGRPEFRLPLLSITVLCVPIGLFIYGWTAQTHQHWIAPNIGACIFSMGNMMTFQCMQTYVVDTYTRYAASAMAAVSVLRSLTAFGFPLFAPYMYDDLHYGWGNSVLAFVSIAIGVPAPIFLWKFGEKLRNASPYATG